MGMRLIVHETLDSTNAEALRRARSGDCGPFWIVAQSQTEGRGRRGRHWTSMLGNLFASLLLHDPAGPEHRAELCFVAGLAVHDAALRHAPHLKEALTIKWPNDLLLSGRKFAGILIEADQGGDGTAVVIGSGVNCTSHPPDAEFPATNLAEAGAVVPADELFAALTSAMHQRLAQWDRGTGFPAIRREWLTHASGLGNDLHVRLPTRSLTGCFETIDQFGRLVLRMPDASRETIAAGEVFPLGGREASAAAPVIR